jgi:hypothetical protein
MLRPAREKPASMSNSDTGCGHSEELMKRRRSPSFGG